MANDRIIQFDVKKNGFTAATEDEIKEIVTKNFLKSQNIRYNRLGDNVGRVIGTGDEENNGKVSQTKSLIALFLCCLESRNGTVISLSARRVKASCLNAHN